MDSPRGSDERGQRLEPAPERSLVAEVTSCVLALSNADPSDGEIRTNVAMRLAAAVDGVPTEPPQFAEPLRALIWAARSIALRQFPDARLWLSRCEALHIQSPELLGYLVTLLMRCDPDLYGDGYDHSLRCAVEASPNEHGAYARADACVHYGDAVRASWLLEQSAREDWNPSLAAWALIRLDAYDEAATYLRSVLANAPPQLRIERLEALAPHLGGAAAGSAERSDRLLAAALDCVPPSLGDLSPRALVGLVEVLEVCMAPDLARRMADLWRPPGEDLEAWQRHLQLASYISEQLGRDRAAAAIALDGYRRTLSLACASLAFWSLSATDLIGDAIDLLTTTDWSLAHAMDEAELAEMTARARSLARNAAQLEAIDAAFPGTARSGRERSAQRWDHDPAEAVGYHDLMRAWDVGEMSQARRAAVALALSRRRGALPLALHIDLEMELGQFDRALDLAAILRQYWPEHPATLAKYSQLYVWLSLRELAAEFAAAAVKQLDNYPAMAPGLISMLGDFDRAAALAAIERATRDERYERVQGELERVASDLQRER